MVDIRLYSHSIWTHSRTPIYTDYYLTDNEIRAPYHRGRPWGYNRVRGRDVWRDLQERRRWTIASVPNWLLNINVNTSEGTTRSSGNIPNGHPHGIYFKNRIRRPCTVVIPDPYPFLNVNIRDGVFLLEERAKLERLGRQSPFSPAVIAIHLDLPDEEPFRKFKDLSNHLARVAEVPDDRGFFFWFIKRQRGQWNTPVKDSSLYFIDFNVKHMKHKFHARDCIKFVVVIGRRDPPRPPYPPPPSPCIGRRDPPRPPYSPHPPPPSPCIGRRDPPRPPYPPPSPRNQEPFIDPGPTFYDGEEVLARWEDDKWYYKGRIARRYDVNNYYCVKDSTSQCDVINWEDIIRATDHYDAVSPDKRDRVHVLAPHPVYYWSYAPGRVIEAIGQKLTVRFYDNKLINIEKWDVYPARNREKYLKDVEDIQQRDWEGKEAVIRDESGVYRPGRVNKQIGCQPMYNVTWQDGQCGEQMSIHIYGTYNKTIKFKVGSYILALVDSDSAHFLPGQVRKVTTLGDADLLDVVFIDGRRSKDALSTDSYWMNEMAYIEAENEFLTHHPDSSDEEEYSR
ncbi:uncharacterized protein LOC124139654 isoform X2 [Haliotis rufescens]|uniref:uncharacterized protein LOC124139654 isoform X2 n=1 Tax=Haliotis rufescens TaxID=6454 RepID=UPI00201F4E78|nr:uncharacterized protein LOC124139654 isoform X2 [Haliotis rufescens]